MHNASFWMTVPVMMFAAACSDDASASLEGFDASTAAINAQGSADASTPPAQPVEAGAEWEYLDEFDRWMPGTFPLCQLAVSCDQPSATCYRNLTIPGSPLGCGVSEAEVFTSGRCALLTTTARRHCP